MVEWAVAIVAAAVALVTAAIILTGRQDLAWSASRASEAPRLRNRIPPVIYRTYSTPTALKARHKKAIELTGKANPGVRQVVLYDRDVDAFMQSAYGGTRAGRAYASINPAYGAARADLFRYCLLYRNGGIYLDIKSGAKALGSLLRPDDCMLVSTWGRPCNWGKYGKSNVEYQQWWLACEPGSPVMRDVIDEVVRRIELYREGTSTDDTRSAVLATTGPIPFTAVVRRYVGTEHLRKVAPDGSGCMVYSVVAGAHKPGASYSSYRGPLIN